MYVDTAVSSWAHLCVNAEVLGPQRMLFGTDSPPLLRALPDLVRAVQELPLGPDAVRAVLGGNAVRLFGLPGPTAPDVDASVDAAPDPGRSHRHVPHRL
jgi:aminocarboxymuconate-semialdehyde decarboxylase